jgi:hypothetical protein
MKVENFGSLSVSPDGKQIALLIHDDPPRWASSENIYIVAANDGAPRAVRLEFKISVKNFRRQN